MTPEQALERDCIAALRSLGWEVYKLSQGYRRERGGTRMTEGIPDLYAIHRPKELTLWMEVKPPEEAARHQRLLARPRHQIPKSAVATYRRATAQAVFGRLMREVGHPYVYGGLGELLTELRRLGFGLDLDLARRVA